MRNFRCEHGRRRWRSFCARDRGGTRRAWERGAWERAKRLHPEGMVDNSPTFQRWVRGSDAFKSRRDGRDCSESAVPTGLIPLKFFPNVETLGFYQPSFWDENGALGGSCKF